MYTIMIAPYRISNDQNYKTDKFMLRNLFTFAVLNQQFCDTCNHFNQAKVFKRTVIMESRVHVLVCVINVRNHFMGRLQELNAIVSFNILVKLSSFLHVFLLLVHPPLVNLLNHSLHIDYLITLSVAVVSGHT